MFPRDPPVLKLVPRGTHQWVDANGTVVSPKLSAVSKFISEAVLFVNRHVYLQFNMHSDLGRLVGEIVEEFQRNPPLMPRDIPLVTVLHNHFPMFHSLYVYLRLFQAIRRVRIKF